MKKKLSNKDIYDAPLKVYSHNNKNEFPPPMVDVVWRRFKDGKMKTLSREIYDNNFLIFSQPNAMT